MWLPQEPTLALPGIILTVTLVVTFLLAVITTFAPRLTSVERIVRAMLLAIPGEVQFEFPCIA